MARKAVNKVHTRTLKKLDDFLRVCHWSVTVLKYGQVKMNDIKKKVHSTNGNSKNDCNIKV